MVYLIEVKSEMGMCAIYLNEFVKYANDIKSMIYMEAHHMNAVCDWAEKEGYIMKLETEFTLGDRVIRVSGGTNNGNYPISNKYKFMKEGDDDIIVSISGREIGLLNYGSGHSAENYKLVLRDWDY